MPNGSDRNWIRFCGAVDGFRYRYGEWPSRVKMESGYAEDLRHILGDEGLRTVQQRIGLVIEHDAHFVAVDERGRSYDYSAEGFPPDRSSPSAAEWLGVEPLPASW